MKLHAWWLVAAGGLGLVLAVTDAVTSIQQGDTSGALGGALTGVLALGAGLLVWARRPESRLGPLLLLWAASGFLLDAGTAFPYSSLAVTVGWVFFAINPVLYAHAILAFPTGRVSERLERLWLVSAYVVRVLWVLPLLLFADPGTCTADCSLHSPSLFYTGHDPDLTLVGQVFDAIDALFAVGLIALLMRRLARARPGARRTFLPIAVVATFATTSVIVGWLLDLAEIDALDGFLDWCGRVSTALVPVALVWGVLSTRRARGAVGDLVLALDRAGPGHVREALAASVGDATLELALWLPDRGHWVDENGMEVALPEPGSERAVTMIGGDGERLAALVHDPDIVNQRPLLEAAGSAARLALENERLQAELRSQLAELRGSRVRLVKASDAERRRLERDLHDGAQQRLLALGLALQLLRSRVDAQGDGAALLDEADRELQEALRELRELARGIHPAILVEQGLEAAIRTVAQRAPVPVRVEVRGDRLPAHVETAAYFVVAEALANVVKYARATAAAVSVARDNGRVTIDVSDDGVGGADPSRGSGLSGLADRVGALDGSLAVESTEGAGTRIHAEIPCA